MKIVKSLPILTTKETYTIEEGLKVLGMTKAERLQYKATKEFNKILDDKNIGLKEDRIWHNMAVATIVVLTMAEDILVSAAPKTGIPKLDNAGWKFVGVAQSIIFWASMIFTFKSLLELLVKGEGSWKKVGTGFLILVFNYLIPWGFETIRDIFQGGF